ncbi:MAG: FAD binding domain-containing protein [Deltaproteobacteria bacterium]|nr:FAD binding domain-containing protein [Deltaproteobacteria bacterium]MBW2016102.1 FAD binding domain-containing protein [Deltaproteobacteria bacterium]MBW2304054.1 FAD binding domain-containing protein [Deltaproteobacteria bacterium]
MIEYDYLMPKSLEEVFDLLKEYGSRATLVAGGTDVMVKIRKTRKAPEVLISLRGLTDLRYIRKNGGYHIGALTTHRMLEQSDLVREELSALHDGASEVGSVQIRNVGTLGGNICNAAPSADTAGPLLALDAIVVLEGPEGRREVPISEFFVGTYRTARKPEEVLVEFRIPEEMGRYGSAYWKHTRRKAMELPLLGVAVSLDLSEDRSMIRDARIALTVAAPTPVRAVPAEDFLKGKALTDEVLEEAGRIASSPECCTPRTSIRCEAWYRQDMVGVFVRRMARLAAERIKTR